MCHILYNILFIILHFLLLRLETKGWKKLKPFVDTHITLNVSSHVTHTLDSDLMVINFFASSYLCHVSPSKIFSYCQFLKQNVSHKTDEDTDQNPSVKVTYSAYLDHTRRHNKHLFKRYKQTSTMYATSI